jgi:hypothetical protein
MTKTRQVRSTRRGPSPCRQSRRRRSGPEAQGPLADSLSAPNPSLELVKESRLLLVRVVSSRRFLKALTASADDILYTLSSGMSELNQELIQTVERFKHSFPEPDDVRRLFSFTRSADKAIRRGAAEAVVHLCGVLLQQSDSAEGVARCLFDALADNNDPEVRVTILPALGWFADPNDSNCETAFECALDALRDPDDRIRLISLALLREFGVDRMSSALDLIATALSRKSEQVRQLGCEVLGDLGADAGPAIDRLLVCTADEARPVRAAAATAIVKVVEALDRLDPGHDHLDIGPADATLLRLLLTSLREAGPFARKFRQRLQLRWSRDATRKSQQAQDVVPQLAEIWSKFTETEHLVLLWIWRGRSSINGAPAMGHINATPAMEVIDHVGWKDTKDPFNLLRSHLTRIRKKLRKNGVGLDLPMKRSSILWR